MSSVVSKNVLCNTLSSALKGAGIGVNSQRRNTGRVVKSQKCNQGCKKSSSLILSSSSRKSIARWSIALHPISSKLSKLAPDWARHQFLDFCGDFGHIGCRGNIQGRAAWRQHVKARGIWSWRKGRYLLCHCSFFDAETWVVKSKLRYFLPFCLVRLFKLRLSSGETFEFWLWIQICVAAIS